MSAELLPFAPQFWRRVRVGTAVQCWPYEGLLDGYGYGRFASPVGELAHRFSWAFMNGRIPAPDENVRHKCDNPPCVNPAHLLIGTHADNMRDLAERGPWSKRCRNGHPRTPETTDWTASGHRRCRICDEDQRRRRRTREKESVS